MSLYPEVAAHREADHEIPDQFLNRWSPRAFSSDPVPEELLLRVMEAARWAASSMNEQPWRFIVANTPETRDRFVEFLVPANQVWAASAPVLILSLAKATFTYKGRPNRLAGHDTGAACAYMTLAASMMGLISHGMGGFDADKARAMLNIPEDFEPLAVWAIGFQGETSQLPQELQEREVPSGRRPLQDTLMWGTFTPGEEA